MNNINPSESFALTILREGLADVIAKDERRINKYNIIKRRDIQLISMVKRVISKYSRLRFSYSEDPIEEIQLTTENDNTEVYEYKAKSFSIVYERDIIKFILKFTPDKNNNSISYSLEMVRNTNEPIPVATLTYKENASSNSWFIDNELLKNSSITSGDLNPDKVESLLAAIYYKANVQ